MLRQILPALTHVCLLLLQEKYVNLNYLGFHKAVKKHDKQLPHAPCQQFYMHVLRNQPWVQGGFPLRARLKALLPLLISSGG